MRFTIYRSEHIPEEIVFDRAFMNGEVEGGVNWAIIMSEYVCVGVYEIHENDRTPRFHFKLDPSVKRTLLVVGQERFDAKAVYDDKAGKYVYVLCQDDLDD